MRGRAGGWAAGGVGLGILLSAVPDPGGRLGTIGYVLPVLAAVAFMVVAVRRVPAADRGPWVWLACAQLMFLGGEIISAVLDVTGNDTWPTAADALYGAGMLAEAVGVLQLGRPRRGASYRGDLLDGAIVTVSAAVLSVVFFVLPIAADTELSPLARIVSSGYPVLDVLIVFLLCRMLTMPGARTWWRWLFVLGQLATLSADIGWNITQLTVGGDVSPRWMNLLWQSYYLLMALAAHRFPAGRSTARPDDGPRPGLTVGRLTVLVIAAVLPSVSLVALAATGRPDRAGWLGTGSVLLIGLVTARIWDLLQQLREQAARVAVLARTDPLTGIPNRRTWDHQLARLAVGEPDDDAVRFVALLDLDHFKLYNDTHGHQAGDQLLKAAAASWSGLLREGEFLARWGGEEFAVLIIDRDPDVAVARLDSLRAVVPNGQTCSIGAARWDGSEEPARVLRRADDALYAAKSAGRDRLVLAPTPAPEPAL